MKEKGCGESSFAGGEHAPLIRTCETWFRQFKNGDFNVKDSVHSDRRGRLVRRGMQAALDDDPTQTQQQLAEALNVSQEAISRLYEQWGRSIKLANGSHTISMIDKFPSQSRS